MRVALTAHAIVRGRERFSVGPAAIRADVLAAVGGQRMSKRRPAWLDRPRERPLHRNERARYVWTECEQRTYVVRRTRAGFYVVLTALRPAASLQSAA